MRRRYARQFDHPHHTHPFDCVSRSAQHSLAGAARAGDVGGAAHTLQWRRTQRYVIDCWWMLFVLLVVLLMLGSIAHIVLGVIDSASSFFVRTNRFCLMPIVSAVVVLRQGAGALGGGRHRSRRAQRGNGFYTTNQPTNNLIHCTCCTYCNCFVLNQPMPQYIVEWEDDLTTLADNLDLCSLAYPLFVKPQFGDGS